MEFHYDNSDLQNLLGSGPVSVVTAADLKAFRNPRWIATIIDALGVASAKAQGLKKPITQYDKYLNSDSASRLYIAHSPLTASRTTPVVVHGFLKVGEKSLLFQDAAGNPHTVSPTCALDFYVHESCRRSGYGHLIFEFMLASERLVPCRLAYDRPSSKFLAFLARYYGLREFLPQANKFVVFDEFGLGETLPVDMIVAAAAVDNADGSCSPSAAPASSEPPSSTSSTTNPITPATHSPLDDLKRHRKHCQRALWGCNPLLGGEDEPETPRRRVSAAINQRGLVFGM